MKLMYSALFLMVWNGLLGQTSSMHTDDYGRLIYQLIIEQDTIKEGIHCCDQHDTTEVLIFGTNTSGFMTLCKFEGSYVDTVFYSQGKFQKKVKYQSCVFPEPGSFYIEHETLRLTDSTQLRTEFYDNGQMFYSGIELNGKKHGEWKYYYYSGELNVTGVYDSSVMWNDVVSSFTKPDYCFGEYVTTESFGTESSKVGIWKYYTMRGEVELLTGEELRKQFEFGG